MPRPSLKLCHWKRGSPKPQWGQRWVDQPIIKVGVSSSETLFSCKTSQDSSNNEAFEKELRFPSIEPRGIRVFRMFWKVGRVRREL